MKKLLLLIVAVVLVLLIGFTWFGVSVQDMPDEGQAIEMPPAEEEPIVAEEQEMPEEPEEPEEQGMSQEPAEAKQPPRESAKQAKSAGQMPIIADSVITYMAQSEELSGVPTVSEFKDDFISRWNESVDAVKTANIAFNVPDSVMGLHETVVMDLLLDMKKTEAQLGEALQQRENTDSILTYSGIEVSDVLEARLIGSETAFRITPVTPERQSLNKQGTTEWRWEVEALQEGSHRLHLTLNAIVTLDGDKETRSIRTFNQEIFVQVSLMSKIAGFIGKNWQWLWTVILVPVASWLWNKRKNKKRGK